MGGDLAAASAGKGKGAAFTLSLPLTLPSAAEEEALADVPAASPVEASALPALRVLVAEDDGPIQLIVRKLLSRLGAVATVVDNGAAAVRAAAEGSYDLILLDLHMPQLDGMAAAERICAAARAAGTLAPPVVAMTASVSEETQRACAAAGMVAHVSKPVSLARLERVIRAHCAR